MGRQLFILYDYQQLHVAQCRYMLDTYAQAKCLRCRKSPDDTLIKLVIISGVVCSYVCDLKFDWEH